MSNKAENDISHELVVGKEIKTFIAAAVYDRCSFPTKIQNSAQILLCVILKAIFQTTVTQCLAKHKV